MRYSILGDPIHHHLVHNTLQQKGHIYDESNPEFVFSIGGDGTILRTVRQYIEKTENIIFVGINLGRLGFYTDFDESEIDRAIEIIETKKYELASFHLLEYQLKNDKECMCGYALNEVAIINPIHTQIIDVYINNKHFETFRGTGFIVSTPSGSTAYSKSLGGSVIDPHIEALQLTEVASINNRVYKTLSSPIVVSSQTTITLKSDFANGYATVDGVYDPFNAFNEIIIKLSPKTARFVLNQQSDFWDRVKKSFLE